MSAKRLPGMTVSGQILTLDVLDTCKKATGTRALTAVVKNRSLSDVVRSTAVEYVTRRRDRKVTRTLIRALSDERVPVRSAAARALGNRSNGTEKPRVMQALVNASADVNAMVRLEAVISLRLARYAKAGSVYTKRLSDAEPRVQHAAAEGLSQLKYAPAIRPLIESLRSRNGLLRELSLKALRHQTGLNYPEDYPLWLEWYQNR